MQCPFCKHLESRVVDSRLVAAGTVTWRRRVCDSCKQRFTTYERVEHVLPSVKKRNGQREPFEREKVLRGLRIACNKRPVSLDVLEQQVDELEQELAARGEREIPSQVIGESVMGRLRRLDEVAYVRFASVYRSFRDVDEFMEEMGKLVRTKPTE
jgi:transcriptional repressor NrdR